MHTDGTTSTLKYPEARDRLEMTDGLILDEPMMAEAQVLLSCFHLLQEVTLPRARRRHNALPLAGYRDILLCGDVRQLPPASGRAPFWSTETFHTMFEIFRLREDRRHEREPDMQLLKEKVAGGSTIRK